MISKILDKFKTDGGGILNYHMSALTDDIKIRSYKNLTCELEPCTAYMADNGFFVFDFIFMRHIGHWLEIIIITEHCDLAKFHDREMVEENSFEDGEWTKILEDWAMNVKPIKIDDVTLKTLAQAYKLANYD